jgi:sigma-B regulation protein RsbU (phosphoserine phosphatase)
MAFTEEEYFKLKAEKDRMDAELRQASELQQSMVPNGYFTQNNVEIFGKLIPAREMGGDLFDYGIRDGKLLFCIGDVCGKGAPAAMLMAYAHAHLGELTLHESDPARIVQILNQLASYDNESCRFFTLFLGVLDLQTGRLQYCNAGHNPPYILSDDVKMLDCDPNQAVGPMEDVEFSLQETTLSPGSTLFLYTDGLTEAKITKEEELGPERAENVLRECIQRQLNPEEIVNTVIEAVHQITRYAPQSDDLTMLAVRYNPS